VENGFLKAIKGDRKTTTEGAEVTCSGRLFQTRAVTCRPMLA